MPVYICGRNDDGALGLGHTHDVHEPALVAALAHERILIAAAGSGHTAFLTADGRVLTAGRGDDNRLGHGDGAWHATPIECAALRSVRLAYIACGSYHTAALSDSGQLFTCGGALFAKLGHANEEPCPIPRPVAALAHKRVIQVACGSRHTVALVAEAHGSEVWTFGDPDVCGLGISNRMGAAASSPAPRHVADMDQHHVTQVVACGFHSLLLTAGGTVWAFGEGKFGRLGTGSESPALSPVPIAPHYLRNVVSIAAGGFHSAAVDALGQAWTWGGGEHGATGLGNTMNQLLPVRVGALVGCGILQVACGWSHTLFLAEDHTVYACGNNDHGKCGMRDESVIMSPRAVEALRGMPVSQIASYNEHSIFLTDPDGPTADSAGDFINNHAWYAQYYLRATSRTRPEPLRGLVPEALHVDTDVRAPGATAATSATAVVPAAVAAVAGSMPAGLPTASPSAVLSRPSLSESPVSPQLSLSTRAISSSTAVSATYTMDMARLFNNPDMFPDVRFEVEGRTVYAHRGILATRCPQFLAMLSAGMRESSADNIIPICDVSHAAFLCVCHFLYTDTLLPQLDPCTTVDVFAAAERFLLDRLKLLCERKTLRTLDVENAGALLAAASGDPACAQLKSACLRFCVDRFDVVSRTPGFRALPKELILEVLDARPVSGVP